jgi:hypothetical protein
VRRDVRVRGRRARPPRLVVRHHRPGTVYAVAPDDTATASLATRPPAFKGIVVDSNRALERAAVHRNLASEAAAATRRATLPVIRRAVVSPARDATR